MLTKNLAMKTLALVAVLAGTPVVEAKHKEVDPFLSEPTKADPFLSGPGPAAFKPEPEPPMKEPYMPPPPAPATRGSKSHQSYAPAPAAEPATTPEKGDDADQDDENDPQWFKAHENSYPCYKLAEQGLFNFQNLRNMDGDWEVSDPKGRSINFNFCHYAENTCSAPKDAFGFVRDSSCLALTSDEPKGEISQFISRPIPGAKEGAEEQGGIRLMRAGGGVCPGFPDNRMAMIVDVWCNPKAAEPEQLKSESKGPLDDDEADPCTTYISLEHQNGCVVFDLYPFMVGLGCFMIFCGLLLQWLGPESQQSVMIFLVRLGTFLAICSFAYSKNYFASIDPSEPENKKDPIKTSVAILLALIMQWVVGILFRYSIRLAPTLLGLYVGYFFSIYFIIAINGCGGWIGLAAAGHDAIDPIMGYVYQGLGACLGALIGYCYSAVFIMLVQTFLSAYFIVRGSTMFANFGFPNEIALMNSTTSEEGGLMKLPPAFYAYSLVIFILWILFIRNHNKRSAQRSEDLKYLDEEQ